MEALSPAEVQVLRGIMTGSSDKAIACQLELDLADVQGHHSSVMVKFGAKSTADAVRTAIYAGLQAHAITCVRGVAVAAVSSGKLDFRHRIEIAELDV